MKYFFSHTQYIIWVNGEGKEFLRDYDKLNELEGEKMSRKVTGYTKFK